MVLAFVAHAPPALVQPAPARRAPWKATALRPLAAMVPAPSLVERAPRGGARPVLPGDAISDQQLKGYYRDFFDHLEPEGIDAVEAYAFESEGVNCVDRGDCEKVGSPFFEPYTTHAALSRVAARAPGLPAAMTLHRGGAFVDAREGELKKGDVFVSKTFMSTSREVSVAESFALRSRERRYIFHIEAPAGQPAIFVPAIDESDGIKALEREVLLPPKTRLRVEDAHRGPVRGGASEDVLHVDCVIQKSERDAIFEVAPMSKSGAP